jgi:hypothetical protein
MNRFLFYFGIMVLINCYCTIPCLAQGKVKVMTVDITPPHNTKVVRAANAGMTAYNTATYPVTAYYDPSSFENSEEEPVDPVWSYKITITPMDDTTNKNDLKVEETNISKTDRHHNVFGANPDMGSDIYSCDLVMYSRQKGQWTIELEFSVKYRIKDKRNNNIIDGRTVGPNPVKKSVIFTATDTYSVQISVDSVICRYTTQPNKRPLKKITLEQENGHDTQKITVSSSNEGGNIHFWQNEAEATSASFPLQGNINNTIEIDIPKTGKKELWISGEKESQKMNDVILFAKDAAGVLKSRAALTVLWVNISIKKDRNEVWSANNPNREYLINHWTENLGVCNIIKDKYYRIAFAFELSGKVFPEDFDRNVKIICDAKGSGIQNKEKNGKTSGAQKYELVRDFGSPIAGEVPVSDESKFDTYFSTTPPDIFLCDLPGLLVYNDDIDNVIGWYQAIIQQFRVFAAYGQVIDGKDQRTRCSSVIEFFVKNNVEIEKDTNGNVIMIRDKTDGYSSEKLDFKIEKEYQKIENKNRQILNANDFNEKK